MICIGILNSVLNISVDVVDHLDGGNDTDVDVVVVVAVMMLEQKLLEYFVCILEGARLDDGHDQGE